MSEAFGSYVTYYIRNLNNIFKKKLLQKNILFGIAMTVRVLYPGVRGSLYYIIAHLGLMFANMSTHATK